MIDQEPDETTPDSYGDLPLQPTGSGVADLEIAYEQMKLTAVSDPTDAEAGARPADDPGATLIDRDDEEVESEGHPS